MEEDIKQLKRIWRKLPFEDSAGRNAISNLIVRNKELEKINTDLLLKLEMKKVLFVRKDKTTNKLLSELYVRKNEFEKDYIPKSKVKNIIQKYYDIYEKEKEYRYTGDVEEEQYILREIEKELLQERN